MDSGRATERTVVELGASIEGGAVVLGDLSSPQEDTWFRGPRETLAARLPHSHPDTIWRRFISTAGWITINPNEIVARLRLRTSAQ